MMTCTTSIATACITRYTSSLGAVLLILGHVALGEVATIGSWAPSELKGIEGEKKLSTVNSDEGVLTAGEWESGGGGVIEKKGSIVVELKKNKGIRHDQNGHIFIWFFGTTTPH